MTCLLEVANIEDLLAHSTHTSIVQQQQIMGPMYNMEEQATNWRMMDIFISSQLSQREDEFSSEVNTLYNPMSANMHASIQG